MTRVTIKFLTLGGNLHYQTLFVKDDESLKDIIEGFICDYNASAFRFEDICLYFYVIVAFDRI